MSMFISNEKAKNLQHMHALQRCKHPENAALLALFRQELEDIKTQLLETDDHTRSTRLRGRADVIKDFLDAVEKSSEVLKKATSQQQTIM